MKKNLTFLIVFISLLGLAHLALATISLDNPLSGVNSFSDLIAKIALYIAGLVVALSTIMFVWAGILFLTSGGNPGQVAKARHAVIYAVIGLAIAIAGAGLVDLIKMIIGVK